MKSNPPPMKITKQTPQNPKPFFCSAYRMLSAQWALVLLEPNVNISPVMSFPLFCILTLSYSILPQKQPW